MNEIYVFLTGLTYLGRWGFKECRNSLLCWLENRQRGIRVSTKALIFRDFGPGSALEHIQDHSTKEFLGGVGRVTYVPSLNLTEALFGGGEGAGYV